MRYALSAFMAMALLSACASSPSVTPSYDVGTLPNHTLLKEGGIYQTSGYGISKEDSERLATANANESCQVFKKMPFLICSWV